MIKTSSSLTNVNNNDVVKEGDKIVIYGSRENCKVITLERGKIFNNKFGNFHHNDIIGKKYGSKVYSKTTNGWMYVLELNPELWNIACPHRTEILYQADISMILFLLELRPGLTVLESGTGSGVLSSYIASSIYPNGKLYTFEYHSERKLKSEEDFKNNGLDEVITIEQRDIVNDGFPEHLVNIDRAFLDLPSPWIVIPKMVHNLKHNSIVSSFSPCIEQVHKTCEAMRECGFVNIITIECLQRPYIVQKINPETEDDLEREKELFVNSILKKSEQTKKRKRNEGDEESETNNENTNKKDENIKISTNKMAMSKPSSTMRGHTGYLTFARLFKKE